MLQNLIGYKQKCIQLFQNIDFSPIIEINGSGDVARNPFSRVKQVLRTYSIGELENMIRVAVGKDFEKLPLGEVISLHASFEYFYESAETSSSEDFIFLDQLNLHSSNNRTSFEEIEDILRVALLNSFKNNEIKYLYEVHRIATALSEKA